MAVVGLMAVVGSMEHNGWGLAAMGAMAMGATAKGALVSWERWA